MWAGVPQGESRVYEQHPPEEPLMYNTYVIQTVARQQVDERVTDAARARRARLSRRTREDEGRR
jgi:hypothetical protein